MSGPLVLAHFANEGFQHAVENFGNSSSSGNSTVTDQDDDGFFDGVGMIILGFAPIVTLGIGFVGSYLLNYVLHDLIFSLASVETPIAGGPSSEKYGILDSVEDEALSKKNDDLVAEPVARRHKHNDYTCSGIRSALRQIQSEAGDLSMFRGIGTQMCQISLCLGAMFCVPLALRYPLKWLHAKKFSPLVQDVVVRLIFAQADTAWLHIIISKPKHKFWFRRLPMTFFSIISYIWMPVTALALTDALINWVPSKIPESWSLLFSNGHSPVHKMDKQGNMMTELSDGPLIPIGFFFLVWTLIRYFLRSLVRPMVEIMLKMPIEVAERRIQASILPDTDDPIIPLDRTFSDGPTSGILAPTQPLPFRRAMETVANRPTFMRLALLNAKMRLITEVLTWAFWGLIIIEIFALVGFSPIWVLLKLVLEIPVVKEDLVGVSDDARKILENILFNATTAAVSATTSTVIATASDTATTSVVSLVDFATATAEVVGEGALM